MTTDKTKRIADALRAYYRSEHSAPITLMHAADLIEQLQRDLDDAQAGESIAQMAAPRAQEPVAYLYHDARTPADAHPWLHSTLLVLAADRRPGLRGETPLYTAPQPADAHEQTAAAMAADNCELWRQRAQRQPLTDEQAHVAFEEWACSDAANFATNRNVFLAGWVAHERARGIQEQK